MPATPTHHTATATDDWDGPAAVKAIDLPDDDPEAVKVGNREWAWRDAQADATTKSAWKFPHHDVTSAGNPTAANVKGCESVIGVLNGGMGGAKIPDADRQAVYDHVAAHLKDAGVEAAELKAVIVPFRPRRPAPVVREQRVMAASCSLRAGSSGREFHGQAAVFDTETPIGNPYRWGFFEKVNRQAFDDSLANDDVVMLVDHDPAKPLARTSEGTLELRTSSGLDVTCPEIPATSYGNDLVVNLNLRNVKGMSFGFEVLDSDWSSREVTMPDGSKTRVDVRELKQVRLLEVSTTAFPAYPTTSAGVRAAFLTRTVESARRILSVRGYADAVKLRDSMISEWRQGKTLSAQTMEALQNVLDLIAAADDAVDEAQPLLAGLMGVPNPDADDADKNDEADEDGADAADSDPVNEQERSRSMIDRRHRALAARTGLPVHPAA